jgi:RNA-directed DNA polymerase
VKSGGCERVCKGSRVSRKGLDKAQCRRMSNPAEWPWVDRTIWTERMLAALGNGVRRYEVVQSDRQGVPPPDPGTAWQDVRANRGAAGVDGQSVRRFEAHAERYLAELGEALQSGRYRPEAVRRVEIPKGTGTRPLGIPTVKDRIVQAAVKRVIEPIFEHAFLPMSYGFRPGRGCKDALREVDGLLQAGYTYVVDADLAQYFDTIPHAALMARIEERISDGRLLACYVPGCARTW